MFRSAVPVAGATVHMSVRVGIDASTWLDFVLY
jgi:hypothetical protein